MTIVLKACPRCAGAVEISGRDPRCVRCGWAGNTMAGPVPMEDPRCAPPTYEASVNLSERLRRWNNKLNRLREARLRQGGGP